MTIGDSYTGFEILGSSTRMGEEPRNRKISYITGRDAAAQRLIHQPVPDPKEQRTPAT